MEGLIEILGGNKECSEKDKQRENLI